MKIALIRTASNQLTYGSYNIQELGLAKSLFRMDNSIHIYANFKNVNTPQTISSNSKNEIRLIPLKGLSIYKEINFYFGLTKKLLDENYDIIQFLDDSQIQIPISLLNKKMRKKKVVLWQGMYRDFQSPHKLLFQKVYDFVFARFINKNTVLKIAKTKDAENYLSRKKYSNIKTLPVGLDFVEPINDSEVQKKIHDFTFKFNKSFFYIGVLEARRDINFILKILQKKPEWGFVLIGNGIDKEIILNEIKNLNIESQVLYIPSIDNNKLCNVYKYIDIFLLPTNYEIVGMVILEALYYGVAVIATPEAGPLDIIKSQELGFCPEKNITLWIDKINQTINNGELRKLRKKYICDNYNWDLIGKKFLNLYENI